MTPGARVQTAIELLDDILDGGPAEKALTTWARRSRFAGSKDRAAVRDHVYTVLRRRKSVLAGVEPATGRTLMLGLLAQDGADVEALFSGAGYGPEPLSDEERAGLARAAMPNEIIDIPEWVAPLLQSALGEKYLENAHAMQTRAPVFLRVNLRKSTPQAAIEALEGEGVTAILSPIAKTALEVTTGARRVQNTLTYLDGMVEIQDASSQAAISELPLRDGMRILDYCAGGGGKILAMGAQIDGTFIAHDAKPERLRDLPARAERAGIQVTLVETDQLKQETGFDLVFCDVPCSGSGTWRRTPDAKWRFGEEDLAALKTTQAAILIEASTHVLPNGTMIYATCSMLHEENENQIDLFLENTPGWSCERTHRWDLSDGCDGFFYAQLTRLS